MRFDADTTDLEKCLYYSLEKISEYSYSDVDPGENSNNGDDIGSKKCSIIILGASGGRIDHTFSAYSQVYKYLNNYSYELNQTDIFMLSKSSCSVYLKPGLNQITTSTTWENRDEGYSVIPIFGEATIQVKEEDKNNFKLEKKLKFGESLFFRKKHSANLVNINLNSENLSSTAFIYSFTTIYHDK